jgi:outer membrane receptor for ferrienterochelin and colicin
VSTPAAAAAEGATEAKGRVVRLTDGDAAPLVYVDGVRLEDPGALSELAPEMIERIEVIKGPAALSFYGDEAAAGVIKIFMKQTAG